MPPSAISKEQEKRFATDTRIFPGSPRLVDQNSRRLLNRWSPGLALLDRVISDSEIRPWLDHLKYLVSDPEEGAVVLDWMAHLVQRRSPKANFSILLGGVEGIGKSLLFDPIVRFIGSENVRTTSEVEIKDKYTSWVAERELVMMEEIRGLSEEIMNRLKMYIAAPPYMVPVNEKNIKHYETPNVARFVAFTNTRRGQPGGISPSRMAEMLEVDKAGPKVRC
jgi:hypothetical protein